MSFEPLFEHLSPNQSVTEVESLCFACHKNVVISTFECPHCHFKNTGIQSASQISTKGVHYELKVSSIKDLNRQLVKSEFASIIIKEIDLELPPKTGCGYLTNVEGLLKRIIHDLSGSLEMLLHREDEETLQKIRLIIEQLTDFADGRKEFTLILDDLTGNSFLENPHAPKADPIMKETYYEQDESKLAELGFAASTGGEAENATIVEEEMEEVENVHCFTTKCPGCSVPAKTRMTMVDIPYFKEVLIMATFCDQCGYKTNEVKTGGSISPKGNKIILKLTSIEDLSRDILKSETCYLRIPEIDLELQMGTLGGRFTTIEGLLTQVHKELDSKVSFSKGDSAPEEKKKIFVDLLEKIQAICEGKFQCTIILEDPLANSYIQNLYAPDPDPAMTVEEFDRTDEQNEDLGILDMKTEDY